jgi:hypothetical protein
MIDQIHPAIKIERNIWSMPQPIHLVSSFAHTPAIHVPRPGQKRLIIKTVKAYVFVS